MLRLPATVGVAVASDEVNAGVAPTTTAAITAPAAPARVAVADADAVVVAAAVDVAIVVDSRAEADLETLVQADEVADCFLQRRLGKALDVALLRPGEA